MWQELLNNTLDFFINHSTYGLFLLSFMESSFFPIPPDLVLIALSIANPHRALWYALVTTAASVLGALLGYYIGAKAGRPVLQKFISGQTISKVETLFDRYSGWAVGIAGFTPIPYKVFTIASGVFRINKIVFVTASILSRGARFFLEGILFYLIGAQAKEFIANYFEIITLSVTVIVVVVYWLLRHTRLPAFLQNTWKKTETTIRTYYYNHPLFPRTVSTYLISALLIVISSIIIICLLLPSLE